jgi:hypothetical protein
MSVLNTLTEGIRARSLANEGEALLEKWEKTGLLEGLDDNRRSNMSRLLENQAAHDVEGFAAVAFPIVRRVFGQLLAQDLVSVQPMSLPSGLIFFLDFTFSGDAAMTDQNRLAQTQNTSVYGGGRVGSQITGGVDLSENNGQLSAYSLNNGFASPTGSDTQDVTIVASGTFGDPATSPGGALFDELRADPSFISGSTTYLVGTLDKSALSGLNTENYVGVVTGDAGTPAANGGIVGINKFMVRRLTRDNPSDATKLDVVFFGTGSGTASNELSSSVEAQDTVYYPLADTFQQGGAIGSVEAVSFSLEANTNIPEIDIKVDSVAVTALTKKLKAKWSPELAQDLNAYHNLDAEVELTSILSEQVALEIDQEILEDLVKGATAGTLYWSRSPGKFLNRETGAVISGTDYPDFTGTVSEWYETLLETVNEVSARIHRKTLRGGANFLVTSPEVANILEFTAGFRASAAVDGDSGSWGAKQVGSISRKMDIHVDPYFPRNLLLLTSHYKSHQQSSVPRTSYPARAS